MTRVFELDKSFQIFCGRSNFGFVQPNFEVFGHLSNHLKKLFLTLEFQMEQSGCDCNKMGVDNHCPNIDSGKVGTGHLSDVFVSLHDHDGSHNH